MWAVFGGKGRTVAGRYAVNPSYLSGICTPNDMGRYLGFLTPDQLVLIRFQVRKLPLYPVRSVKVRNISNRLEPFYTS
jgi:hypothetical protein